MKLRVVLFANLLLLCGVLAVRGQRSFELVCDSNVWLTSDNAAALTTFGSANISEATLFYRYGEGDLMGETEGKGTNGFGADVRSYMRLSPRVVVYGEVSYDNVLSKKLAGSMFFPTEGLKPFDLVESDVDNAGDKRREQFNAAGAVGWNILQGWSIGASADFTAATYAKYRDLRHTNFLMNLDARVSMYYAFGKNIGIGAGYVYHRRAETVKFKTYGTTDKTFTTLVDYAGGYGQIETFGGDGFTDSSNEQPLLSQSNGVFFQGEVCGVFGGFTYSRLAGYYGKQSQYTACYAKFSGDSYLWQIRYTLPRGHGYLCFVDASLDSQILSTRRTNYRKVTSNGSVNVTYYEYYDPTKVADKALNVAHLGFTGYWKPVGSIYTWCVNFGTRYAWRKQTAYLYPYTYTGKTWSLSPYVMTYRNIFFANTSLLKVGADYSMRFKTMRHLDAGVSANYEFALPRTGLRPAVGVNYRYSRGLGAEFSGQTRHNIGATVALVF